MKITIEHESFSATTTSLIVAEKLLETIRLLQCDTQPKRQLVKPINVSESKKETPPEVIKPTLPRFNPAWLEKHIDFNKSKIVRYSNPCSTMHGKCGEKCWQTELLVETGTNLDTCDCEFYDLDELRGTLDMYIKIAKMEITKTETTKQSKHECHCSRKRLQHVADLVKQGCSNKQIAERLGISLTSVSTYKSDCKQLNILN